jgi:predicted Zn-dependent protease with MMP-like domain
MSRQLTASEREALDRILEDVDAALDEEDLGGAEELLAEAVALAGPEHPDVRYAGALVAWERGGPRAAQAQLEAVVRSSPDHADARHALALVLEEADDHAGMVEQFLEVRRLDERSDRRAGLGSRTDLDFIERIAEEVLEALPEEFRARLRGVPVVLEPRPSEGLVGDGFDPRAYGLFEGLEDGHTERVALSPTRIVLFCSNLLAAFGDDEELAEQIEITILHEVGHFFGLDEDDVARLGLE